MKHSILTRPLAFSCAAFLICLALFMNVSSALLLIFSSVLIATSIGVAVFLIIKRRRFLPIICILAAIMIASVSAFCYNEIYYKNKVSVYNGEYECEFTVTDNVKYDPYYTVSHVTVTSINKEKCNIRAVLVSSFMSVFNEGHAYRATLELEPTKRDFSFGENYDFSKGFLISASCTDPTGVEYVGKRSDFPYTAVSKIQKQISVFFDIYLEDEQAAICKALLDGDKTDLPIGIKRSFSQLGISHMLAISGMHLSVIIGILALFVNKLRLHKKGVFLTISIVTLVYVFLTGFSLSVLRAALMLIITYAAFWFGRRSDAVSALLLCVSLICVVDMPAVFDVGLWLSFMATLGILLVGAPVSSELFKDKGGVFVKIVKWILSAAIVSISATMFTFIVIAVYFKEISFVLVISNILFALPLTLVLVLIMTLVLCSPISFLAKTVAYPLGWICRLLIWSTEKLAKPTYLLSLDFEIIYVVSLLCGVLVFVLLIKRKRKSTLAVFAGVMALVIIANVFTFKSFEDQSGLGYYGKGKNDALYIKSGANTLVIDNSYGGYAFIRDTLEMTNSDSHSRVTLMLTHYHVYMAYGIATLSENALIDAIILPTPSENEINTYNAVIRAAEHYSIEVREYSLGEECVSYNGVSVDVYSEKSERSDHKSIAIVAHFSDKVFVYHSKDTDEYTQLENVKHIYGFHALRIKNDDSKRHVYYEIEK